MCVTEDYDWILGVSHVRFTTSLAPSTDNIFVLARSSMTSSAINIMYWTYFVFIGTMREGLFVQKVSNILVSQSLEREIERWIVLGNEFRDLANSVCSVGLNKHVISSNKNNYATCIQFKCN